jgi:hypothetical protein
MHTVCSLQPKDQEGGSWQDRKILDDTTLLQKPMAPPSPILPRLHGERGFLHLPHNYEAAQITVRLSAADHAAHMGPPALEVTRCPAPSLLVSQKASWVSGGGGRKVQKIPPLPNINKQQCPPKYQQKPAENLDFCFLLPTHQCTPSLLEHQRTPAKTEGINTIQSLIT